MSREYPMEIAFTGEAGEIYDRIIDELPEYGVRLYPEDGEPFDAILLGTTRDSPTGADWYGQVKCIRVVGDEYDAKAYPPEAVCTVIVRRIEVF